jgi:uncharacterized protein YndB with AHSA1/START domain
VAKETIDITHEFSAPVDQVFGHLSEHENLGPIFGIRVERAKDGNTDRNGVGSIRRLSLNGLMPFEETVTDFKENELIEYTITKGTPIKDHLGTMRFSATESGGTKLHYVINIDGPPIIIPLVAMQLRRSIAAGLRKASI